jgi:hypothetical protein
VLFGTDFPMAPDIVIGSSVDGLDRLSVPGLSAAQIYRQNAAKLLKRSQGAKP